jgi:serine/threonine protein kinase
MFEIIHEVAEGAFGTVYQALCLSTNEMVAIKYFEDTNDYEDEVKAVQHLQTLQSIHLIYPMTWFSLCIIYPWIEGSCLADYLIDVVHEWPFEKRQELAKTCDDQLTPVLRMFHDHHLVHRDISPTNIMYTPSSNHFTLIDYGSLTNNPQNGCVGRQDYTLPEVWSMISSSSSFETFHASDQFALQCVLRKILNLFII